MSAESTVALITIAVALLLCAMTPPVVWIAIGLAAGCILGFCIRL